MISDDCLDPLWHVKYKLQVISFRNTLLCVNNYHHHLLFPLGHGFLVSSQVLRKFQIFSIGLKSGDDGNHLKEGI